jgi:hypothetical protein
MEVSLVVGGRSIHRRIHRTQLGDSIATNGWTPQHFFIEKTIFLRYFAAGWVLDAVSATDALG